MKTDEALKTIIQERYGAAARQAATSPAGAACCGGGGPTGVELVSDGCQTGVRLVSDTATRCCGSGAITSNLYSEHERGSLPAEAVNASLGCGNPTALIDVRPGDVVLDLGSGGGIDVLLSAHRVGPTGKVYGLDMTDDMLALARENQRKAGVPNVEFLKGEIEEIPLPDNSVDFVISNCVINLSADKARVLREAFRVLKPGGRLAVSDVVAQGEVPDEIRSSVEAWIGCVAGALDVSEYRDMLATAGFTAIDVDTWRVYDANFASAFIRATKP